METYDLDGARIDAVKHVENLAVSNLVAQINERFETVGTDVYLKGETAMGWSGHSLEANQAQYDAINAYMGPEDLTVRRISCSTMRWSTMSSSQATRITSIWITGPTAVKTSTRQVR